MQVRHWRVWQVWQYVADVARMRWSVVRMALLLMIVAACSGSGSGEAETAADTMTRAQRDSMIGASSLPGAGAVQRALDVADSAAARAATMDSLAGN